MNEETINSGQQTDVLSAADIVVRECGNIEATLTGELGKDHELTRLVIRARNHLLQLSRELSSRSATS